MKKALRVFPKFCFVVFFIYFHFRPRFSDQLVCYAVIETRPPASRRLSRRERRICLAVSIKKRSVKNSGSDKKKLNYIRGLDKKGGGE